VSSTVIKNSDRGTDCWIVIVTSVGVTRAGYSLGSCPGLRHLNIKLRSLKDGKYRLRKDPDIECPSCVLPVQSVQHYGSVSCSYGLFIVATLGFSWRGGYVGDSHMGNNRKTSVSRTRLVVSNVENIVKDTERYNRTDIWCTTLLRH
jgi:hypothetical protein